MKAELLLKSAERQETYPLTSERLTIGRSINTHVRLTDKMVSREHCEILRMGDRYVVRDLGSSNGTLINGKPTPEKVLEWGDKIQVGETTLIFFQDQAAPEGETDVSVTKRLGDDTLSRFLRATEIDVKAASEGRSAGEYLYLLYDVGLALMPKESVAEVCNTLVKILLRGRRFGRAAVVLFDEKGEVVERFTRIEGDAPKYRINLEAGVLRRVFDARESVYRRGESIEDMAFSSMIVPVTGRQRVYGAVYIDDLAAGKDLKDTELHLLSALGQLVGLVLENVLGAQRLRYGKDNLRRLIASENDIIGDSKPIQKILDLVTKVAPTDATVLLKGESGVGKELVARAIHLNSPRADSGPLIAVNCGAIPRDLLESDLFGHEKGAFTGATARRKGRFEAAQGGTLFLDEVGELPLEGQVKLLRVLDERRIHRVGGTEEVGIDVRIIAATNRDLAEDVARGAFRQDLYYRLNVLEIAIPPLRDRREDILILAYHFLELFAQKMGKRVKGIGEEAKKLLRDHAWPGNVRELKNAIERAVLLAGEAELRPEDFPSMMPARPATREPVPTLDELERRHIEEVLRLVEGNRAEAARLLGINRSTLYEKIAKYSLPGE